VTGRAVPASTEREEPLNVLVLGSGDKAVVTGVSPDRLHGFPNLISGSIAIRLR
jgi:hypothetical protein